MSRKAPKHVHTYERVSTDYQWVENQTRYLDQWCKQSGENNIVRLSEVVSGKKMTGKAFQTLWDAVKDDLVSKVVVYSVDRLGRNMRQACAFVEDCYDHGVVIVFLDRPNLDLSTADGMNIFHQGMANAVYEQRKTSERTKKGLERAALTCGKCYHYDNDHKKHPDFTCTKCGHKLPRFYGFRRGKPYITKKTAAKVREILKLWDSGFKKIRIKEMLGGDERTIARIINNRENLPPTLERKWDQ